MKMKSYDIFDTVVTRKVFIPSDIFYIVENKLLKDKLIRREDFFRKRLDAEDKARKESREEEITLDDIYANLGKVYHWNENDRLKAMQRELAVEEAFITPIGKMVDDINKGNKPVIFISDSYLPNSFLEKVLKKYIKVDFKLYVSSSYKKMKHFGSLYDIVLAEQRIGVHVGDNVQSDIRRANEKKIKTEHFSLSKPTIDESILGQQDRYKVENILVSGCMKSARLFRSFNLVPEQTIWNVSTNIAGPVLFSYVLWLLTEAKGKGIERLYFVARDGEILYEIASAFQKNDFFKDIGLYYLYGSRRAWHTPAITDMDAFDLEWIFGDEEKQTLQKIAIKAGIDREWLCEFINSRLEKQFIPDQVLDESEREGIKQLFECNAVLKQKVFASSEEKREVLFRYLEQEKVFQNQAFAIVDIGWNGRLQRSFSKLAQLYGYTYPIKGYYFALSKKVRYKETDELYEYFSTTKSRYLLYYRVLFELFVSASHKSTVGYSVTESKVIPVFDKSYDTNVVEWGLSIQQDGILTFVQHFLSVLSHESMYVYNKISLENAISLLHRFFEHPSLKEAETYGKIELYDDQERTGALKMAIPLQLHDLMKVFVLRKVPYHGNLWIEASFVLSRYSWLRNLFVLSKHVRFHIRRGLNWVRKY